MSGQEEFFDFLIASRTFFSVTVLSAKEFFLIPTSLQFTGSQNISQ
jgi:hypothetical protein